MAAQEPPDILDVNIAQRPGQQGPVHVRTLPVAACPAAAELLVGGLRIDRLLARPRLVLQPFKAMVGIAMPPKADNPRLDTDFLGDRPRAAPGRRQQNDPRPLQIARNTGERQRPSSTLRSLFERWTSLCFGYHPDVESRLTI